MNKTLENLLDWASREGLTDAELARKLHESPQTLNNWKRRGAVPDGKVVKIAQIIGVPTDWLLTSQDPAERRMEAGADLPRDEQLLLEKYRRLSPADRARLQEISNVLARPAPEDNEQQESE